MQPAAVFRRCIVVTAVKSQQTNQKQPFELMDVPLLVWGFHTIARQKDQLWATEIVAPWSLRFKCFGLWKRRANAHLFGKAWVNSRVNNESHSGGRKQTPMLNSYGGGVWFIEALLLYSLPSNLGKWKDEDISFKLYLDQAINPSILPSTCHLPVPPSVCQVIGGYLNEYIHS